MLWYWTQVPLFQRFGSHAHFCNFVSPSFIRTVKYWCYCTTMERNVRRRIRLVCPGCDDMFHSQHSFNLHLLSSEFCYFVDQCGVNTNQPSSNQQFPTSGNGINDSSKFQTKGPVPYEFVSDHYRVSLDDYLPSEIQVNDTDFQPLNKIDALPKPPNLKYTPCRTLLRMDDWCMGKQTDSQIYHLLIFPEFLLLTRLSDILWIKLSS